MPRDPDDLPLPIREAVDERDVEESLAFLLATAEEAAHAVALAEEADDRVKRARAMAELASAEKSADRRSAEAMASASVERAIKARSAAITRKVQINHLRRWHELRIEVWRTLQANKRQGGV